NTSTLRMAPVPVSSSGCMQSADDHNNPVVCDATTCTATVNIGTTTKDAVPWKVKFGYKVTPVSQDLTGTLTPDFMITNVYYAPPGKSSNMAYKSTTSVGTTVSATESFEMNLTVTAGAKAAVPVVDGTGVKVTASNKWGTTKTDETDISID